MVTSIGVTISIRGLCRSLKGLHIWAKAAKLLFLEQNTEKEGGQSTESQIQKSLGHLYYRSGGAGDPSGRSIRGCPALRFGRLYRSLRLYGTEPPRRLADLRAG